MYPLLKWDQTKYSNLMLFLLITMTILFPFIGVTGTTQTTPTPKDTSQDPSSVEQKPKTTEEDGSRTAYRMYKKCQGKSIQVLKKRYRSLTDVSESRREKVKRMVRRLGNKSYRKRDRARSQLLEFVQRKPLPLFPLLKTHLDKKEHPQIRASLSQILKKARQIQPESSSVQKLFGLLAALAEHKQNSATKSFLKRVQETYPNSAVDHFVSRLLIVPVKPETIQQHFPPYSGTDTNYKKSWLDMVVNHCRRSHEKQGRRDDWPTNMKQLSAFSVKANQKISTRYQFRTRLLKRPEKLKKQHQVSHIVTHKNWFIAPLNSESLSHAYAVQKNTQTIYFWFNW